mmetsp:Transcript_34036/g.78467  ORF Transcript_34036/g.78467 Transcript_34036/m.78467 type:complete len:131 (+) Transcript_34036:1621-2013(+)
MLCLWLGSERHVLCDLVGLETEQPGKPQHHTFVCKIGSSLCEAHRGWYLQDKRVKSDRSFPFDQRRNFGCVHRRPFLFWIVMASVVWFAVSLGVRGNGLGCGVIVSASSSSKTESPLPDSFFLSRRLLPR